MNILRRKLIRALPLAYMMFTLLTYALPSANKLPDRPDDQIRLNVTVTNKSGNPCVNYLTKEDFIIQADKKPVEITHFSRDDVPVSMGILLDVSGSIKEYGKDPLSYFKSILSLFIRKGRAANEYFIYKFSDTPELVCDWTRDTGAAIKKLESVKDAPKGSTAFFDICFMAIEKLKSGSHQKKVLLMITDAQDNASKKNYPQLRQLLQESDVIVYSIGLIDSYSDTLAGFGKSLMKEMTDISAGKFFFLADEKEMNYALGEIIEELRCHYTIGFKPPDASPDGKWHKLQVKLTEIKDDSASDKPDRKRLKVRACQGYLLKLNDHGAKQQER